MVRRGSTVRVRQRASRKDLQIGSPCSQMRRLAESSGHRTDTYWSARTAKPAGFSPLCPQLASGRCFLDFVRTTTQLPLWLLLQMVDKRRLIPVGIDQGPAPRTPRDGDIEETALGFRVRKKPL